MLFCDFQCNLKKLNPYLWIDAERRNTLYHSDFPIAGIYHEGKYITGTSHNYVPEYTILGVNPEKLREKDLIPSDFTGNTGQYYDQDFIDKIPNGYLEYKVLAKGYRAILSQLCRLGLIKRDKAERLFNCSLEPSRYTFPKRYIDLGY